MSDKPDEGGWDWGLLWRDLKPHVAIVFFLVALLNLAVVTNGGLTSRLTRLFPYTSLNSRAKATCTISPPAALLKVENRSIM